MGYNQSTDDLFATMQEVLKREEDEKKRTALEKIVNEVTANSYYISAQKLYKAFDDFNLIYDSPYRDGVDAEFDNDVNAIHEDLKGYANLAKGKKAEAINLKRCNEMAKLTKGLFTSNYNKDYSYYKNVSFSEMARLSNNILKEDESLTDIEGIFDALQSTHNNSQEYYDLLRDLRIFNKAVEKNVEKTGVSNQSLDNLLDKAHDLTVSAKIYLSHTERDKVIFGNKDTRDKKIKATMELLDRISDLSDKFYNVRYDCPAAHALKQFDEYIERTHADYEHPMNKINQANETGLVSAEFESNMCLTLLHECSKHWAKVGANNPIVKSIGNENLSGAVRYLRNIDAGKKLFSKQFLKLSELKNYAFVDENKTYISRYEKLFSDPKNIEAFADEVDKEILSMQKKAVEEKDINSKRDVKEAIEMKDIKSNQDVKEAIEIDKTLKIDDEIKNRDSLMKNM